jgi:hypothetical protein
VGVVALGSDPARRVSGGAASRLVLGLPDALVTLAMALTSFAVLLLFAFLLATARLRGQDQEAKRALRSLLLFPVLIAAVFLLHRGSPDKLQLFRPGPRPLGEGPAAWQSGAELPTVSAPLYTALVGALILAAGVSTLGLVCLVLFGDRLTEWWRRARPAPRDPLASAVEESLDDLRDEVDARRAIIRCYRRFELVLARSRVPRAPWQTPLEFMRDALGRLPLPPIAVEQLTRLFEIARFSDQALARTDRDTAWASLLEIRSSLEAARAPGRKPEPAGDARPPRAPVAAE